MISDQEDEKRNLNNKEPHINRGFELLLRNRRRNQENPKSIMLRFGKMVSLFYREIHFYFEISLDFKKSKSRENKKC
jgi:hypothetical protein